MENIEDDFTSGQGGVKPKIQTPDKVRGAKNSSSKKINQFETPKMSQVKLKH